MRARVNMTTDIDDNATYADPANSPIFVGVVSTPGTTDEVGESALIVPEGKPIILDSLCKYMYISQGSTGVSDGRIRRVRMSDRYVDTPLLTPSGVHPVGMGIGLDHVTFYFYAHGQLFKTDLLTWSTPVAIAGQWGVITGYADGTGTNALLSETLAAIIEIAPGVLLATDTGPGTRSSSRRRALTPLMPLPPPPPPAPVPPIRSRSARLRVQLKPQCLRKMNLRTGLVSTIMCGPVTTPDPWLAGMSIDPPRSLAYLSLFTNAPEQIWAVDVSFTAATPRTAARPASCAAGTACVALGEGGGLGLQSGATLLLA
eukprot:tig00000178_g12724.t1